MYNEPPKKYKILITAPENKRLTEGKLIIYYGGGFDGHFNKMEVKVLDRWGGVYMLESKYKHKSELDDWCDASYFYVEAEWRSPIKEIIELNPEA